MKIKTLCAIAIIAGLVLAGAATGSYANCMDKGKEGCLEGKFCQKMAFIMANEKDLALTADQVKKLDDLKSKTRKDMIRMNAGEKIAGIETTEALHQDTIDVAVASALADKEYDLKKEKAKALIASFAALKETLTKEQKDKMKELWKAAAQKACHDGKMCSMMKCPKCGEKMCKK